MLDVGSRSTDPRILGFTQPKIGFRAAVRFAVPLGGRHSRSAWGPLMSLLLIGASIVYPFTIEFKGTAMGVGGINKYTLCVVRKEAVTYGLG